MTDRPSAILPRVVEGLLLVITLLVSAEITARVEDRIRSDISVVGEATDRNLVIYDRFGVRGNPNTRFKKWRLNGAGFRSSQETAPEAKPGCVRVMVLGASETFGLYESDGKEYPAQLSRILERRGCYEVVNAALAGMTVRTIVSFWDLWASRFKPAVVVVYPSPAFYLAPIRMADTPAPGPRTKPVERGRDRWWMPRIWNRAQDRLQFPAFIQRHRVNRWLAESRAGQPPGWLFDTVPQQRLQDFVGDVEQLVCRIAATGARPVVVTHATGFHDPVLPDERDAINAWNAMSPRATQSVLLRFEHAAAAGLIDMGHRRQVTVVDAASHMYGKRSWFAGDMVHFSDEGAGVIADLIAENLLREPPSSSTKTAVSACGNSRTHAIQ